MNLAKFSRLLVGVALFTSATLAHAVSIEAIDRGWFGRYSTGSVIHTVTNTNYFVGVLDPSTFPTTLELVTRNFFVFDLSAYSGQSISSATLHLYNPNFGEFDNPTPALGGYHSDDATETYELHQVSSPTALLAGTGGISTYNDLGDGVVYGGYLASLADNGRFIDIILNADALSAINTSAGGLFAIGGLITSAPDTSRSQSIFSFTNNPDLSLTQLIVTIPEPSSLVPFVLGMIGIGFGLAKRRVR